MSVTVEKVSKEYEMFVRMAMSICKNPDTAQDLTQAMFLRLLEIQEKEGSLDRLAYKDEINKYFCYRIMMSIFLNERKRANNQNTNITYYDPEDMPVELSYDVNATIKVEEEYQAAKDDLIGEIEQTLKELHWYDARLFKEYGMSDKSFRELAAETNISITSIFNTIKNVKQKVIENTRPSKIDNYIKTQNNVG